MKDLLSVSNIIKTFNQRESPVLNEISFNCARGQILGIIGSSGSGKTTLLRIISGLDIPNSGEIILNDKLINGQNNYITPEERDCTLVFQDFALFPNMTVKENISFGKNALNNLERVQKLLKLTKIEDLQNRYPHEISGGEQQRVALVRALVTKPSLLLMDEPLSHLDQELRDNVRFDLINLFRETKTTVLFVSHDTEDAMEMADKIVVLNDGKVDQIGTPMEIYSNPVNKYVALLFGKTNLVPLDIIPDAKHHFFDPELNKEVISVRPHQWKIGKNESRLNGINLACKVISARPKGALQEVKVEYKNLIFAIDVPIKHPIKMDSYVNLYFEEN